MNININNELNREELNDIFQSNSLEIYKIIQNLKKANSDYSESKRRIRSLNNRKLSDINNQSINYIKKPEIQNKECQSQIENKQLVNDYVIYQYPVSKVILPLKKSRAKSKIEEEFPERYSKKRLIFDNISKNFFLNQNDYRIKVENIKTPPKIKIVNDSLKWRKNSQNLIVLNNYGRLYSSKLRIIKEGNPILSRNPKSQKIINTYKSAEILRRPYKNYFFANSNFKYND